MFQIGKLFVSMMAKDRGLNKSLDSAKKKGKDTAGEMNKMGGVGAASGGKMVAAFFAARVAAEALFKIVKGGVIIMKTLMQVVLRFGIAAVRAAADLEEMESKFEAVFGKQAPKAAAILEDFADRVGRSRNELKSMASELQDVLEPMGFTTEEAAGLSIKLTKLGIDVASFNNKLDVDVINNFKAALTGSHEVLKQYGVVIDEATLKTELARLGYKGASIGASQQLKVLARMNILMRGTTKAQGDAEKTSGSLTNTIKGLTGIFKDWMAEVGKMFVPAVMEIASALKDVMTIMRDSGDGIEDWGETFRVVGESIGNTIRVIFLMFTDAEFRVKAFTAIMETGSKIWEASVDWAAKQIVNTMEWALVTVLPALAKAAWVAVVGYITSIIDSAKQAADQLLSGDFTKSIATSLSAQTIASMKAATDGLKKLVKEIDEAPEIAPFDMPALTEWNELVDEALAKIGKEKKDGKKIDPFGEIDPKKFLKGKAVKVKFELVGVQSLFAKNLKEAFAKSKDDQKIEFLKKGVDLQNEQIKQADANNEKVVAAIENQKPAGAGR